ncbi:MAG: Xaa-Pro aminopeptidase [Cocleimonas sp.]|nr:Xaa-Pro aminopeptidase [Cocleimonas sp.]
MKTVLTTPPQFPKDEFSTRRTRLLDQMERDSIAIIPSAALKMRNRDAEFPFRQDSDFLYLTNFNEPNAIAVLIPEHEAGQFLLFCREKDAKTERWTGRMAGLEGAKTTYQADNAFPIDEIDTILPSLMENRTTVYYSMGVNPSFDQQVMTWISSLHSKIRKGITAPHALTALDLILHEMRLVKSEAEQSLMRYAAQTSVIAHQRAMKRCQAEAYEYQIEAEILHEFRQAGMEVAYTSIVGGGENGCILHYIENNQCLKAGDLLLIDAGAEYQGYASDITRTFPVSGKFSDPQRALYQLVLDAQAAAIEQVKPNNTWIEPHEAAVKVLAQGLLDLGLLQGDLETVLEEKTYTDFYMHNTGHWLGLDVHDVGRYKINETWRTLEVGMVLTVEPGLYISPNDQVDPKWWNIGIRIEDDILVTPDGNEVLTAALLKEVDEIEAFMMS